MAEVFATGGFGRGRKGQLSWFAWCGRCVYGGGSGSMSGRRERA